MAHVAISERNGEVMVNYMARRDGCVWRLLLYVDDSASLGRCITLCASFITTIYVDALLYSVTLTLRFLGSSQISISYC